MIATGDIRREMGPGGAAASPAGSPAGSAAPGAAATGTAARGGFTLVELLVTLAVVALLVGLISIGVRAAHRTAGALVERQAALNLQQGIERFKQAFGFYPPLIRKSDENDTRADHTMVVEKVGLEYRINVYRTDRITGGVSVDERDLRARPTGLDPANPFKDDRRYSEYTFSVYLMGEGAGNASKRGGKAGTDVTDPIDGANGAGANGGFGVPRTDGTFEPVANTKVGSDKANRTGSLQQPMIQMGGRALVLQVESDENGEISIRNKGGGHYRYYRWLNGKESPVGSGTYVIDDLADYRVPLLVGRRAGDIAGDIVPEDRDLDKNPALRVKNLSLYESGYAIVGAGANGMFGDEDVTTLIQALGRNVDVSKPEEVLKLRLLAERDNVVLVGQP